MPKWWKHITLIDASYEEITAEVELYRCLRRVNEILDEHSRLYAMYVSINDRLDRSSEEQLWSQVTEVIGSSGKLATLGNVMYKLAGEGLSQCAVIRQTLPIVMKHYEHASTAEADRLSSLKKWTDICESHLQHILEEMKHYRIKTELEEEKYYGEILGLKGKVTREDISSRYETRRSRCEHNKTPGKENPFHTRLTELEKLQIECAYSYFKKKYSF